MTRASAHNWRDVAELLAQLAEIAPVLVIPGNHDLNVRVSDAPDLLTPLVTAAGGALRLQAPRVTVWRQAGVYQHPLLPECLWFVGIPDQPLPDVSLLASKLQTTPNICAVAVLMHETINGCRYPNGVEAQTLRLRTSYFQDIAAAAGHRPVAVLLGDIHLQQEVAIGAHAPNLRAAYPGSLICQNVGEPHLGHGWAEWNLRTCPPALAFHEVPNPRAPYTLVFDEHGKDVTTEPRPERPYYWHIIARGKPPDDAVLTALRQRHGSYPREINVIPLPASDDDALTAGAAWQPATLVLNQEEEFAAARRWLEQKEGGFTNRAQRVFAAHQAALARQHAREGIRVKLLRLEFSNLYCYGPNNVLDLDMAVCKGQPGLVGLVAPNATGKSSLLDILALAMTGRPGRGQKHKILREGAEAYRLQLTFSVDGQEGKIRMSRRGTQSTMRLTVAGQDTTQQYEVERKLRELFGSSKQLERVSLYRPGRVQDFVQLDTKAQNKELSDLLMLGHYQELKERLDSQRSELNITIRERTRALSNALPGVERTSAPNLDSCRAYIDSVTRDLRALHQQRASLEKQVAALEQETANQQCRKEHWRVMLRTVEAALGALRANAVEMTDQKPERQWPPVLDEGDGGEQDEEDDRGFSDQDADSSGHDGDSDIEDDGEEELDGSTDDDDGDDHISDLANDEDGGLPQMGAVQEPDEEPNEDELQHLCSRATELNTILKLLPKPAEVPAVDLPSGSEVEIKDGYDRALDELHQAEEELTTAKALADGAVMPKPFEALPQSVQSLLLPKEAHADMQDLVRQATGLSSIIADQRLRKAVEQLAAATSMPAAAVAVDEKQSDLDPAQMQQQLSILQAQEAELEKECGSADQGILAQAGGDNGEGELEAKPELKLPEISDGPSLTYLRAEILRLEEAIAAAGPVAKDLPDAQMAVDLARNDHQQCRLHLAKLNQEQAASTDDQLLSATAPPPQPGPAPPRPQQSPADIGAELLPQSELQRAQAAISAAAALPEAHELERAWERQQEARATQALCAELRASLQATTTSSFLKTLFNQTTSCPGCEQVAARLAAAEALAATTTTNYTLADLKAAWLAETAARMLKEQASKVEAQRQAEQMEAEFSRWQAKQAAWTQWYSRQEAQSNLSAACERLRRTEDRLNCAQRAATEMTAHQHGLRHLCRLYKSRVGLLRSQLARLQRDIHTKQDMLISCRQRVAYAKSLKAVQEAYVSHLAERAREEKLARTAQDRLVKAQFHHTRQQSEVAKYAAARNRNLQKQLLEVKTQLVRVKDLLQRHLEFARLRWRQSYAQVAKLKDKLDEVEAQCEAGEDARAHEEELRDIEGKKEQMADLDLQRELLDPDKGVSPVLIAQARTSLISVVNRHLAAASAIFRLHQEEQSGQLTVTLAPGCSSDSVLAPSSDPALVSGYQSFVLELAIRAALEEVARTPLPSLLLIDEGFGCLDGNNLSSVSDCLQILAQGNTRPAIRRPLVMAVSHRDDLRPAFAQVIDLDLVPGRPSRVHWPPEAAEASGWIGLARLAAEDNAVADGAAVVGAAMPPRLAGQLSRGYEKLGDGRIRCLTCDKQLSQGSWAKHVKTGTHAALAKLGK